jgi:DNA-binding PadR family transcriptional regulator
MPFPPPFGGFPFGGPHGGPDFWGRGRRGSRASRGDVRAAALALIAEEPRNGYQIIQEIERRSDGLWRPSPGSVYPALQQLEDEGLVRVEESGGRKAYVLTAAGEDYVASHGDELTEPWGNARVGNREQFSQMRETIGRVALAYTQVLQAGNPDQIAAASKVLLDAATSLYRILAGDLPFDAAARDAADDTDEATE